MYHVFAKNKEGTEGFAELVQRVHPVGDGRCWIEPASGIGFFGSYDDLYSDVDIIRVCAGGNILKVRLKGEEK